MIIDKNHIAPFAPVSINIADRFINPDITNAGEFDIKPVLGLELFNKCEDINELNIIDWDVTTGYILNDKVIFSNKIYNCLAPSTGDLPAAALSLYWLELQVGTFWLNYIVPFASFAVMKRFTATHGVNYTQSGLRVNSSNTDFPVDGATRSTIVSQHKNDSQIWQNKTLKFLCDINWTLDLIIYSVDCAVFKKDYPILII